MRLTIAIKCSIDRWLFAPLAQLDRVLASEAKGQWFESTRVYRLTATLKLSSVPLQLWLEQCATIW